LPPFTKLLDYTPLGLSVTATTRMTITIRLAYRAAFAQPFLNRKKRVRQLRHRYGINSIGKANQAMRSRCRDRRVWDHPHEGHVYCLSIVTSATLYQRSLYPCQKAIYLPARVFQARHGCLRACPSRRTREVLLAIISNPVINPGCTRPRTAYISPCRSSPDVVTPVADST
jgi:hypothetical protein